jgi:hypothetical protein
VRSGSSISASWRRERIINGGLIECCLLQEPEDADGWRDVILGFAGSLNGVHFASPIFPSHSTVGYNTLATAVYKQVSIPLSPPPRHNSTQDWTKCRPPYPLYCNSLVFYINVSRLACNSGIINVID